MIADIKFLKGTSDFLPSYPALKRSLLIEQFMHRFNRASNNVGQSEGCFLAGLHFFTNDHQFPL
jgi:hypothetical protein